MSWRRHGRDAQDDLGMDEGIDEAAWEYLVEEGDVASERLEYRCNELGAAGWELVSVIPLSRLAFSSGGRTTGTQLFFKRPAP